MSLWSKFTDSFNAESEAQDDTLLKSDIQYNQAQKKQQSQAPKPTPKQPPQQSAEEIAKKAKIPAALQAYITAKIAQAQEAERSKIIQKVQEALEPKITNEAAKAAEREVDSFVEAAQGETVREKLQAILTRVHELPPEALETLFLRRAVMADALRRVLLRVELEDAVDEWEDLGR